MRSFLFFLCLLFFYCFFYDQIMDVPVARPLSLANPSRSAGGVASNSGAPRQICLTLGIFPTNHWALNEAQSADIAGGDVRMVSNGTKPQIRCLDDFRCAPFWGSLQGIFCIWHVSDYWGYPFFFVCFCGLSTCLFCYKSFKQLTDIGTFVYFFKHPFLKRFKCGFVRMIQGHVQVGALSTSLVKTSKPTIEQLNSCIELDVTKHIRSLRWVPCGLNLP